MRSRHSIAWRLVASAAVLAALSLHAPSASADSSPCVPTTTPCPPTVQPGTGPTIGGPPIVGVINYPKQLIVDGSFEHASATLPNSTMAAWNNHWAYYVPSNSSTTAKCGSKMLYIAGRPNGSNPTQLGDAGRTNQRVTIPAGAASTKLDFWVYFPDQPLEQEELTVRAFDTAQVTSITSPITWTNLITLNNGSYTRNTWHHITNVDLGGFAGKTIVLEFKLRTDLQYDDFPGGTPEGIYIDWVAAWTGSPHLSIC
jgi:hypothetical protein